VNWHASFPCFNKVFRTFLVDITDTLVKIDTPVSESELVQREEYYEKILPNWFATKFRGALYQPVKVNLKGHR